MPNIDRLNLQEFSKFDHFLWVCWILGKTLSNFESLHLKLYNRKCHSPQVTQGWWQNDLKTTVKKLCCNFLISTRYVDSENINKPFLGIQERWNVLVLFFSKLQKMAFNWDTTLAGYWAFYMHVHNFC